MSDQESGAVPLTLLEQSGCLREKIQQVQAQAGNEQTLRTWRPIQEALLKHRERIESLAPLFRNLRKHKVITASQPIPAPNVRGLLEKMDKLRAKLLNKPGKVMEGNTWANCDTILKTEENALEANLKRVWASYVGLLIPPIDHLKPFVNLGRCATDVERITRLRGELIALQSSLPGNETVFRDVDTKAEEIKRMVAGLDLGDVPIRVKGFIEKVNSVLGATLEDVDDEVLAWLREKKLLSAFRIK